MKYRQKFMLVNTSVDDLRSSLWHIKPETEDQIKETIQSLQEEISYETRNKKRSTVIKMLQAKIKNIIND